MQIVSYGDYLHEISKPIFGGNLQHAGKKISIWNFEIEKKSFNIPCKLSPMVTTCMKYRSLFSGKIDKKNIINLSYTELVERSFKIKLLMKRRE